MKKVLVLFFAIVLLLMSCTPKPTDDSATQNTASLTNSETLSSEGKKEPVSSETAADPEVPAESNTPNNSETSAETQDSESETDLSTTFFDLVIPDNWKVDEEGIQDSENYCEALLYDGVSNEEMGNRMNYSISTEDSLGYRKTLYDWGLNLEDVANGSAPIKKIGDLDFLVLKEEADELVYKYRDSASGTTATLQYWGDGPEITSDIEALLDGFKPKFVDNGLTEAPWPWEGTPYTPTLTPQMVGTFTITPEQVVVEGSLPIMDIMEHQFFQRNDKLYHLDKNNLTTYDYTPTSLKKSAELVLDNEAEMISGDNSGMLYLSQGIYEVFGVKDNAVAANTTIKGDLIMANDGFFGISYWINSDTYKVTNENGILSAAPWIFTNLNDDAARVGPFTMIDTVELSSDHIMVGGSIKENAEAEEGKYIKVYNHDDSFAFDLIKMDNGEAKNGGHYQGIIETENGFMAADGNMRTLEFWSKDGTFLGTIETDDLFGTNYPWIEDAQLVEDGSILLMLSQEREDLSADELLFFRLTGF